MGTAFEVACLFLIRPDLFTLMVCLKTTACTMIWLSQGSDPTGKSSSARPSGAADGTVSLEFEVSSLYRGRILIPISYSYSKSLLELDGDATGLAKGRDPQI